MNVNDSLKKAAPLPTATQPSVQSRSSERTTKTESKSTNASDSVKLSSQYQALESKVADNESFNAQKVEQIKAAIASGQFQINPEKIANGLLDTVKGLLSTRQ